MDLEEFQVGGGNQGAQMDEFASEPMTDFSHIPLEKRLESKVWNQRVSAYEEIKEYIDRDDHDVGRVNELISMVESKFKAIATEATPTAIEKGYELIVSLVYVMPKARLESHANGLLNSVITKGMSSKAVDKVQELVCRLIEQLSPDTVLPPILDFVTSNSKAPKGLVLKQLTGALALLRHLLLSFGPQYISPKSVASVASKLAASTDRGIREECYGLLVDLVSWTRALELLSKDLAPPQQAELAKRCESLPPEAPRPLRQPRHGQQEAAAVGGKSKPQSSLSMLVDEVDVPAKLPAKWSAFLTESKWAVRRDALQVLANLVESNPVLVPPSKTDFRDVTTALQRTIKQDSNLVCVQLAIRTVAGLMESLKRSFAPLTKALLPACVARLKEKNKPLLAEVERVMKASLECVPLEILQEEVSLATADKNTHVRMAGLSFLGSLLDNDSALLRSNPCPPSNEDRLTVGHAYVASIASLYLDDASKEVRELSTDVLARALLSSRGKAFSIDQLSKAKAVRDAIVKLCPDDEELQGLAGNHGLPPGATPLVEPPVSARRVGPSNSAAKAVVPSRSSLTVPASEAPPTSARGVRPPRVPPTGKQSPAPGQASLSRAGSASSLQRAPSPAASRAPSAEPPKAPRAAEVKPPKHAPPLPGRVPTVRAAMPSPRPDAPSPRGMSPSNSHSRLDAQKPPSRLSASGLQRKQEAPAPSAGAGTRLVAPRTSGASTRADVTEDLTHVLNQKSGGVADRLRRQPSKSQQLRTKLTSLLADLDLQRLNPLDGSHATGRALQNRVDAGEQLLTAHEIRQRAAEFATLVDDA